MSHQEQAYQLYVRLSRSRRHALRKQDRTRPAFKLQTGSMLGFPRIATPAHEASAKNAAGTPALMIERGCCIVHVQIQYTPR